MSDENSWDADDFEPTVEVKHAELVDEDKLDEQLKSNGVGPSDTAASSGDVKAKTKPAKSKKGAGDAAKVKDLTAAEILDAQKASSLQLAIDLLGVSDVKPYDKCDNLDEFKAFAETLAEKLLTRQNSDHFPGFLEHLLFKIYDQLEAKYSSSASGQLKALADTKHQQAKKSKQQTKPTVKAGKEKKLGSVYDDFLIDEDSGAGGGGRHDIDEDFM